VTPMDWWTLLVIIFRMMVTVLQLSMVVYGIVLYWREDYAKCASVFAILASSHAAEAVSLLRK